MPHDRPPQAGTKEQEQQEGVVGGGGGEGVARAVWSAFGACDKVTGRKRENEKERQVRMHEGSGHGVAVAKHAVVIAGEGPTGLMLAGELALARIDVAIVERRENVRSTRESVAPLPQSGLQWRPFARGR